jgi:hypothetical protein
VVDEGVRVTSTLVNVEEDAIGVGIRVEARFRQDVRRDHSASI